jgi:hypothetical protein
MLLNGMVCVPKLIVPPVEGEKVTSAVLPDKLELVILIPCIIFFVFFVFFVYFVYLL